MADHRKTLLIVEDGDQVGESLAGALRAEYRILRASSGEAGLLLMEREAVDVIVLDVALPGISGLDVLKICRENYPNVEVIVVSDEQHVETAVEAMRHGAYHYLSKAHGVEAILGLVDNASERQDLRRDVLRLSTEVAEQDREFVVGPSPTTREVLKVIQKVAGLPATVLVLGESGTGKELAARLIHRHSGDPGSPFVTVNLAAIPGELVESTLFGHERGAFTGAVRQQIGKFELANGGTLFLDEIGDMRHDIQAKLLRALQENEIERIGGGHPIRTNFRLIAATNVDLDKAVREGRFRGDLYYRLNVIPIRMPALRDRIEDLPDLARFFLRRCNVKFRKQIQDIADSTLEILSGYWWPGNIRELENLIERLAAVSDKAWITDEDLPYEFHLAQLPSQGSSSENLLERAVSAFERSFMLRALEKSNWNVTATARHLGLPLSTMKFKMDRLEIRDTVRKIRGH